MKKLILATSVAAFCATSSNATTVVVSDYIGAGVGFVDDSIGFDIIGAMGLGADGTNDIALTENPGNGDTSGRFSVDSRDVSVGDSTRFQRGDLARNSDNELYIFQNGDEINSTHFQGLSDTAILYGGGGLTGFPEAPDGVLPNAGDRVVLGFRFQIVEQTYLNDLVLLSLEEATPIVECGEEEEVCAPVEEEVLHTVFGFFEIERGSIVPLNYGYNASGAAVVTTAPPTMAPVPLPAAGWMLIAGVGGLLAAGRRKKA